MEPTMNMKGGTVKATRSALREFMEEALNNAKIVSTPSYHTIFNPANGYFMRWGETFDDDPTYSPIGPELADIEISTICHKGCKWCYKNNTPDGKVMTLDQFKEIFQKLPKTVNQIAFGIGDLNGNPDLLDIMWYTRDQGVIPNITISDPISDVWAFKLAEVCGAVAVSHYDSECYDSVEKLSNAGLKQVNIHQLLAQETLADCYTVLDDAVYPNPKLKGLNAIIFLSLKQTGRGQGMHPVTQEEFAQLVAYAEGSGLKFGFDSCSACKLIKATGDKYKAVVEPCESGLFSIYIDVHGIAWPCSFFQGSNSYLPYWGLPVTNTDDFLAEGWYSPEMLMWRRKLLKNKRRCPIYDV